MNGAVPKADFVRGQNKLIGGNHTKKNSYFRDADVGYAAVGPQVGKSLFSPQPSVTREHNYTDTSAVAKENGDPLTKMDSISIKGASRFLNKNPDQSFGKWIRSSIPSSMKTGGNTDKIIGMYDDWQSDRSGAQNVLNTFTKSHGESAVGGITGPFPQPKPKTSQYSPGDPRDVEVTPTYDKLTSKHGNKINK